MSVRQNIISALIAALEGITIENGYNTDAGNNVAEWKTYDSDPAEDGDTIVVHDIRCEPSTDAESESDDNARDYDFKKLTVNIILLTCGKDAPQTLRLMIDDVCKAIGSDDSFGGIADNTEWINDQTDVDKKSKTYGGTLYALAISYRCSRWRD